MRAHQFSKIPLKTRQRAMLEFAVGGKTTKQIADKYGFNNRRLKDWFEEDGRLNEFRQIVNKNVNNGSKKKMPRSASINISGYKSINWKGRKLDLKHGMISGILLPTPEHPKANKQGYVYEHRLVMENVLGRHLTDNEVVHHVDLDPTNNHSSNLMLMSVSEHGLLHIYLQHALVKLIDHGDLRKLSEHLLGLIKQNGKSPKCDKRRHDASVEV